ncbi:protein spaetzle 5 isoform X2 [Anopheles stephensi]|nr:protein spaetzle 5 isoform X2 [Anopheles stephensi]XP_035907750.1 protein spaetzle 5 isoform X2 [Anopheles stephensi]
MAVTKVLQNTSPFVLLLLNHLAVVLANPSPYPHPTLAPQKPGCGLYGQSSCPFVPAPPGTTPKCASPGSTFCESNPDYPSYLIKHLVESLGYQRIIANEEMVDFGANKPMEEEEHLHHHYHHFYGSFSPMEPSKPSSKPPPSSGAGYNYITPSQQAHGTANYEQKRPVPVPQPIYIPKPQHSYHYNSYVRAPMYNRHGGSSGSGQGYYYPHPQGGSSPGSSSSSPSVTQYSPADWLKRFARDLSDKHSREARLASLRRVDESIDPFETEPAPFRRPAVVNETVYERLLAKHNRPKRESELGKETLCSVRERYITPQTALNTKGNWMFVVNQENSRQLVKTEVCASTECSNLCSFPVGYSSRCEQRYVQKRLVTLDPSGRNLYVDTYWFPSCCVCSLYSGNRI